MVTEETKQASQSFDIDPEPCRISQAFASSVTKDCFQSLIVLLRWSWTMLKSSLNEHKDKVSHFHFHIFIFPFLFTYFFLHIFSTEKHCANRSLNQQSLLRFKGLSQIDEKVHERDLP